MHDDIEFEPSTDLMRRDVRAALRFDARVNGRAVRFQSNSSTVIGILHSAFVAAPADAAADDGRAVVRIVVIEGDEAGRPPGVRRLRLDAGRVLVATCASIGLGDALRADGLLYVTAGLVRDSATFLQAFVEPVARAALDAAPADDSGAVVAARPEAEVE
jgi:hypothetical protein